MTKLIVLKKCLWCNRCDHSWWYCSTWSEAAISNRTLLEHDSILDKFYFYKVWCFWHCFWQRGCCELYIIQTVSMLCTLNPATSHYDVSVSELPRYPTPCPVAPYRRSTIPSLTGYHTVHRLRPGFAEFDEEQKATLRNRLKGRVQPWPPQRQCVSEFSRSSADKLFFFSRCSAELLMRWI